MAGKRKNREDDWLPPRVYRGRSAWEYRPDRTRVLRLCDFSCSPAEVWQAYENISETNTAKNFAAIAQEYTSSLQFRNLATETQKSYLSLLRKINPVFGEVQASRILPKHVRKYMDMRGEVSQVQANREKTLMSVIFSWAYERGKVDRNPCNGVKNFSEHARTRYINDDEYNAIYSMASDIERIAMEIAYLCCARRKDIVSMRKSQIMEAGIFIKQSKTTTPQIKAWTRRLRAVIQLSENLPLAKGRHSEFIIHKPTGDPYTLNGFSTRWQNLKKRCAIAFPDISFDFTFHDLKAKGVSDLKGNLHDKQKITGHKSISHTARYDRKISIVPVVGGQDSDEE